MKILNFGSCNIDYVYTVDHIVLPGETEPSGALELFPGGKGLNQSIALARAGVSVYHAGAIGADGVLLEQTLAQNGVALDFLDKSGERSGHAIIQLSSVGENSILLYPGANATLTQRYVDHVLSHFGTGDVLLLQNETNLVPYIIDRAYEKGMRTLFNPAPFTPSLSELDYHKISWLVLNEIEAMGLGGGQTPEESLQNIRNRYPGTAVVMTLGGDGCVYADSEHTLTHPAFHVEVVDTTAAGDTFIGYFLAAAVQDKNPVVAISRASAAAALAVSKKGAAPSIPYAKEVTAALGYLKAISKTTTRRVQLQSKMDAYLHAHLSDATLSGLACELGYSKVYTGELVRKLSGICFSELLQQMRCHAAAELLLAGELSVEDVIARVGYKNESFFRSLFKKTFGVSPYHYKKSNGGML